MRKPEDIKPFALVHKQQITMKSTILVLATIIAFACSKKEEDPTPIEKNSAPRIEQSLNLPGELTATGAWVYMTTYAVQPDTLNERKPEVIKYDNTIKIKLNQTVSDGDNYGFLSLRILADSLRVGYANHTINSTAVGFDIAMENIVRGHVRDLSYTITGTNTVWFDYIMTDTVNHKITTAVGKIYTKDLSY